MTISRSGRKCQVVKIKIDDIIYLNDGGVLELSGGRKGGKAVSVEGKIHCRRVASGAGDRAGDVINAGTKAYFSSTCKQHRVKWLAE